MKAKFPLDIFEPLATMWAESSDLEEYSLLRLAILRDLSRKLHAERSRFLAEGKKDQVHELKRWEHRLEELRNASSLDGTLEEVISEKFKLRKKSRILPERFFVLIEKEKFDRPDRLWEQAIASEACSLGWKFWTLQKRIGISQAAEWNLALSQNLWPFGLSLFVESVSFESSLDSNSWQGKWFLTLHPRFDRPEEIPLDFASFAEDSKSAPAWKLLFSARKL